MDALPRQDNPPRQSHAAKVVAHIRSKRSGRQREPMPSPIQAPAFTLNWGPYKGKALTGLNDQQLSHMIQILEDKLENDPNVGSWAATGKRQLEFVRDELEKRIAADEKAGDMTPPPGTE
jgi:hypothetical protein